MKKQIIRGTAAALAAASFMAVGAVGASYLQEISAYLNYGISVKYDGEEQRMYDANGQRVYPISYNGTTYVPIRAVGNMMGINVAWDGANNAVLLGKTGVVYDFIDTIEPYSSNDQYGHSNWSAQHYTTSDYRTRKIADTVYDHYIAIGDGPGYGHFYNLEGKYTTLTFNTFSESNVTFCVYGDNEEVLAEIKVKADALPATYKIDVSGVQQLSILSKSNKGADNIFFIVDATIE